MPENIKIEEGLELVGKSIVSNPFRNILFGGGILFWVVPCGIGFLLNLGIGREPFDASKVNLFNGYSVGYYGLAGPLVGTANELQPGVRKLNPKNIKLMTSP